MFISCAHFRAILAIDKSRKNLKLETFYVFLMYVVSVLGLSARGLKPETANSAQTIK